MPGSLETITYQAQVLSKGSIHTELLQRTGSADGSHGSTGGGGRDGKSLSSRSWSPSMRSPFKDALQKISRISRVGDRSASAGGFGLGSLQSQPSDVLPKMQFLQRALTSMRTEQGRGGTGAAAAAAGAAGKPGAGAGPLHTVVEVRGGSLSGPDAEASAAAARQAVSAKAAAATGPADKSSSQQQQQDRQRRSLDRPPSFDLRATDVVLGANHVRRRMLAGQQSGEAEAAGGSPRAAEPRASAGAGSAAAGSSGLGDSSYDNFAALSGRPIVGGAAGHLSTIKRRSANYS